MTAKLTLWLSAAFVSYVYVGYPLLLWILQFVYRRPVRKKTLQPSVSLLVTAYNEADVIDAKIRNALAVDYPTDRLEIVIASDGSTDSTAETINSLIQREGESRIRVLAFPENRGKVAVSNDSIPRLRGDIVVFTDASGILAPDAIRRLVANFADSDVGAVSGTYRVLNQEQADLGPAEAAYWKYESFLKLYEGRLGCLTGAHGGLYAMRKELYPFPPPDTINDDFVIPTRVLQQGFLVTYEPEAVVYEEAREMAGFRRRIRIWAGNVQQLREIRRLISPFRPLVLFCFLSHKAGRLFVPIAMIALAVANVLLWRSPAYAWLGLMQTTFYGLALAGALWPLKPRLLRLPFYFCMVNSGLFAWIFHAVRVGRLPVQSNVTWS